MTDPSVKGHAQEWKIKVKQIRGSLWRVSKMFVPLTLQPLRVTSM